MNEKILFSFFFFQAEDGIRDGRVTGVQTCALPISSCSAALPPKEGGPVLENLSHPPLRIAIVAPPWLTIPPGGYGGVESMVHTLVEGLATRGHEIVLVGAGKPHRSAKFLQTYDEPPLERMGEAFPEVVHALAAADHLADLVVDVVRRHP